MLRHDAVRRALRTFVQALLTAVLVAAPVTFTDAMALDWPLVLAGVAYSSAIAMVSWLHNELEDAGRVRDTRAPREGTP